MSDTLKFSCREITESYEVPPPVIGSQEADRYRGMTNGCQGQDWEPPDRSRVYTQVEVLPFLTGKPWDDVTLAWVSSLRPTRIRVVAFNEGTQLDAQSHRVTVYMDTLDRIKRIEMEVDAWVPEYVESGRHLVHLTWTPNVPFQGGAQFFCNEKALVKVQFDNE